LNKLLPLLAFSILLLVPVGTQNAFAIFFLLDSGDPNNVCAGILGGTFDLGLDTCTLSGSHQIADADFVRVNKVKMDVKGTLDVFGLLATNPSTPLINSGVINVHATNTPTQGRIDVQSPATNECNGIINLMGGPLVFQGTISLTSSLDNLGTINTNAGTGAESGTVRIFSTGVLNNHGFIGPDPVFLVEAGAIFNDNLPSKCEIVGGELIPIESTSLLLAGAQTFSWMIPVVLSVLGIGLFVVSRKSENS